MPTGSPRPSLPRPLVVTPRSRFRLSRNPGVPKLEASPMLIDALIGQCLSAGAEHWSAQARTTAPTNGLLWCLSLVCAGVSGHHASPLVAAHFWRMADDKARWLACLKLAASHLPTTQIEADGSRKRLLQTLNDTEDS